MAGPLLTALPLMPSMATQQQDAIDRWIDHAVAVDVSDPGAHPDHAHSSDRSYVVVLAPVAPDALTAIPARARLHSAQDHQTIGNSVAQTVTGATSIDVEIARQRLLVHPQIGGGFKLRRLVALP